MITQPPYLAHFQIVGLVQNLIELPLGTSPEDQEEAAARFRATVRREAQDRWPGSMVALHVDRPLNATDAERWFFEGFVIAPATGPQQ